MLPNTARSFCSICLTSTLVMLGSALQVYGQDFVWSAAGDGDWTTPANWNVGTGFPNAAELDVNIYGSLAEEDTTVNITLNQEVTFGKLFVRANTNNSNFIISGAGGSFVVDNGASPADIGFGQGGGGDFHSIDVPISVVSDTLILSGRLAEITGNITAVFGNDLTINSNWGTNNNHFITLSGDNQFNNGTIVSVDNASSGIRFADSATAAGGPSTSIQLTNGHVQFENSTNGTDIDFGNSIDVSGTGTSVIGTVSVATNNSVYNTSVTLGDITLAAGSTLQYLRLGGGSGHRGASLRVGSGHDLTLGYGSTLLLQGSHVRLIDVMDQSLLQGTGTIQITDDNTDSRVRVFAGGTVRPGVDSDTGILNIGSDTVQGRLEMQEDSIMRFRLNGTTAGDDYDQLRFGDGPSGESSLMAAADSVLLELELNFAYDASDVVFIIRNDQEMALTDGDFFQDFSQGDTITFSEGTFAGSTALISYEADYDTNLTTGGYSVALYGFSVIPEPSSAGLLLGAFALGLTFSRRRRT